MRYLLIGLLAFFAFTPSTEAAISFVATSTAAGSVASGNYSITTPSGATTGDVLVFVAGYRSLTKVISNVCDASAKCFTEATSTNRATTASIAVWYRVLDGSEGTTWTVTNTGNTEAVIAAYRGVDTANPIDASAASSTTVSGTAVVFPQFTTVTANAWYIGAVSANIATGDNVAGAGSPAKTERADVGNGGAVSTKQSIYFGDRTIASPAATGYDTQTLGTSNVWNAWSFALRPSAGGGGGSTPVMNDDGWFTFFAWLFSMM